MSLTVTTDVFCDEPDCVAWIFGTTSHRTEAGEARRAAAKGGWTRQRRNGRLVDLCPEHS